MGGADGARLKPMGVTRAPISPPGAASTEGPRQSERVAAAALSLAVRRIVLDAGQGGSDPGASSLGLAEKDITLDIGRRLRHILEENGFEVVVTRPDDRTLRLRDRAQMANKSRSDIFVSITVTSLV